MIMYTKDNINGFNDQHRESSPQEIISFALQLAERPVITTNFRPYEAAILHACTSVKENICTIWCDSGYNTEATYSHAQELIDSLNLNISLYVPAQTAAYRTSIMGIPEINDKRHALFTEQVKLEPFKRAMAVHRPDVWFTNLRKGQTALRDSLDIFSLGKDGILKVSPFYHYTDKELDVYLEKNKLPNEFDYYDPTKVLAHRECGIHI
ncbi:phosphoadenosine phosphosulfate reductase family protein [Dokdonia sp. Hel_I_53]|uniref:phosphoadenosine phosphosulfate reductase domain-containing protein n=1 Tax=Dokdonia sp. Hel_I_53 TaxID=1566287 RepID=UPI00119A2572|nr:phosphoadenosine phosphosulfate reductase family protein [Dokdonia sp. Hel_I_53]TVZ51588.1 phosphoadenylylsulfate reductase (thioredoxin) [Dokdonia sp. Hel_I_53]